MLNYKMHAQDVNHNLLHLYVNHNVTTLISGNKDFGIFAIVLYMYTYIFILGIKI